jgi:hypothetical protein
MGLCTTGANQFLFCAILDTTGFSGVAVFSVLFVQFSIAVAVAVAVAVATAAAAAAAAAAASVSAAAIFPGVAIDFAVHLSYK